MKMRRCVIPCGQTEIGSSQKHFLPFRVLLNVGIHPKFLSFFFSKFFFTFGFTCIKREILLSGEKAFSVATLSAIIYHIRSN